MKRLSIILTLLCGVALAGAFASGTKEAAAPHSGPATIRVWSWLFTQGDGPAIKSLIADFQQKHPNTKVEIDSIPWGQAYNQILLMFQTGNVPDLIGVNRTWLTSFVSAGYLQNLTPYVDKVPGLKNRFFPAVRGNLDGKTWILPYAGGDAALVYNKTTFANAGLTPPKTLSQFVQAGKKLSDPTNNKFATVWDLSASNSVGGNVTDIGPLLTSFGGQYVRNKKAAFNNAAGVETLQWMMNIQKQNIAAPGSVSVGALGMRQKLAGGTVAMTFDGAWGVPFYNNYPSVKVGFAEMPKGKNVGTVINIACWGIPVQAKHKAAAWKLLSFLMTDRNLLTLFQKGGDMPIVPKYAQMPAFQKKWGGFLQTLADTHNYYQTGSVPQETEMDRLVVNAYQEAFLGKMSPQAALDQAAAKYDKVLSSFYSSK